MIITNYICSQRRFFDLLTPSSITTFPFWSKRPRLHSTALLQNRFNGSVGLRFGTSTVTSLLGKRCMYSNVVGINQGTGYLAS